jgi:hypothetical protein
MIKTDNVLFAGNKPLTGQSILLTGHGYQKELH